MRVLRCGEGLHGVRRVRLVRTLLVPAVLVPAARGREVWRCASLMPAPLRRRQRRAPGTWRIHAPAPCLRPTPVPPIIFAQVHADVLRWPAPLPRRRRAEARVCAPCRRRCWRLACQPRGARVGWRMVRGRRGTVVPFPLVCGAACADRRELPVNACIHVAGRTTVPRSSSVFSSLIPPATSAHASAPAATLPAPAATASHLLLRLQARVELQPRGSTGAPHTHSKMSGGAHVL